MPAAIGAGSSFDITELTGKKRSFSLTGRGLPHRPIEFGGTQQAEFTWNTGNPVATAQILGPREDQTVVKGIWKDIHLATGFGVEPYGAVQMDGTPLPNVAAMMEEFDDVRRQGQLLEVRWENIFRQGILTKFKGSWDNVHDCEWEMTFQWISQGDLFVAGTDLVEKPRLSESKDDWITGNDKFFAVMDTSEDFDFDIETDLLDDINQALLKFQAGVIEFEDAINAAVEEALEPIDTFRRCVGITEFFRQEANFLRDTLEARVDWSLGQFPSMEGTPPGKRIAAAATSRRLKRQARDHRHQAARQRRSFLDRIEPRLLGTHVAKDGQDVRDVSRIWYGNQNNWQQLIKFNQLTSSKLRAGQTVMIPKLRRTA